jgi:hypothetical protein
MNSEILIKLKDNNQKLQQQIAELSVVMQSNSKELIKQLFKDFFERYAEIVHYVFWTQYTPYYNDGEACEFRVNDVYLVLKNDEDPCDCEGSPLFDQHDIANLNQIIAEIEAREQDPLAAARKYQAEYIKKYNRNPFNAIYTYQNKTEEELMREWTPYHSSKKAYQEELSSAEFLVRNYPAIKADFAYLRDIIASIDSDIMKAIFGDHVIVEVYASKLKVIEITHD